jgi:hypothetical protein
LCGEREREKRKLGSGSERHYRVGGGRVIETKVISLKVSRQCPLVLLVEARLVFGICSILIFKDVGAAVHLSGEREREESWVMVVRDTTV